MYAKKGEYYADLRCNGVPVPLQPSMTSRFCISQDLNRMLPEMQLEFSDAGGKMTHFLPSDLFQSRWSVDFGYNQQDFIASFAFDVYRRTPEGFTVTAAMYDMTGIGVDEGNSLCSEHSRSFTGSLAVTLTKLAKEIGCDEVQMSPSLYYSLPVTQPGWSTVRLINYLQRHLVGSGGEVGYCAYVKHYKRKRIFVFRTIEEMIKDAAVRTYYCGVVGDAQHLRLYTYNIIENKLLTKMAPRDQRYSYFDWEKGTFVETTYKFNGLSLSDNLGYDTAEKVGNTIQLTGRTNETDQSFKGLVGSSHTKRAYSLVQMWASVQGDIDLCPGDSVKLVFGANPSDLFATQYSGYWLIQKVTHNFGDRFSTYLLLTRNGYDVSYSTATSLVKASSRKRT